jgi:sortase (surface protein transpeptidase)
LTRRLKLSGAIAAVLVVLAGCTIPAIVNHSPHGASIRPAPVLSQSRADLASIAVPAVSAGPAAAPSVSLADSSTAPPSTHGVPTSVDIPAIGVHGAIVPLGIGPDGTAEVPSRFDIAGWYSAGPRPGDSGPAVLLGHVDSHNGPAVFFRLRDLHPGDIVTVTSLTGPQRFQVDTVASFPKTAFPTDQVYGPVTDRALRLVTCGGTFDDARHSYDDNVIVFATAL